MSTLTAPWRQGAQQAWASLAQGWRDLRRRADPVNAQHTQTRYHDGVLRLDIPRADR